ncbi:unnamed protein product, partial [Ectocarpus sp. 4 AP-2014]
RFDRSQKKTPRLAVHAACTPRKITQNTSFSETRGDASCTLTPPLPRWRKQTLGPTAVHQRERERYAPGGTRHGGGGGAQRTNHGAPWHRC